MPEKRPSRYISDEYLERLSDIERSLRTIQYQAQDLAEDVKDLIETLEPKGGADVLDEFACAVENLESSAQDLVDLLDKTLGPEFGSLDFRVREKSTSHPEIWIEQAHHPNVQGNDVYLEDVIHHAIPKSRHYIFSDVLVSKGIAERVKENLKKVFSKKDSNE